MLAHAADNGILHHEFRILAHATDNGMLRLEFSILVSKLRAYKHLCLWILDFVFYSSLLNNRMV